MNVPKIRGLAYIGEFSDPHVNGGQPLPLYDFAPRTDGKPDINTLEGWNRMRHDFSAETLRKQLGREPDEVEIQVEMERNAAEARSIVGQIKRKENQNTVPATIQQGHKRPQPDSAISVSRSPCNE